MSPELKQPIVCLGYDCDGEFFALYTSPLCFILLYATSPIVAQFNCLGQQ